MQIKNKNGQWFLTGMDLKKTFPIFLKLKFLLKLKLLIQILMKISYSLPHILFGEKRALAVSYLDEGVAGPKKVKYHRSRVW